MFHRPKYPSQIHVDPQRNMIILVVFDHSFIHSFNFNLLIHCQKSTLVLFKSSNFMSDMISVFACSNGFSQHFQQFVLCCMGAELNETIKNIYP